MSILAPLEPDVFADVRRRAIFDCFKWDPQVEDVSVLAPYPLVLSRETWVQLAAWAEALAGETLAAEAELVGRPDLHRDLALPWGIRRALREAGRIGASPGCARVMRFDFHPTDEGWRVSEVNSDVPGGFVEAGGYSRLIASHYPGYELTTDPAQRWAEAVARAVPPGAVVALVHATAYTDDRQVMLFLSQYMERLGVRCRLVAPDLVDWDEVAAVVRFFPGEWLVNLPRRCGWRRFFAGAPVPVCNPATALLTQSKRLPVVWDRLRTPMPAWRTLLPETRDPREVRWQGAEEWVVKPALGRVGDAIGIAGVTTGKEMAKIARAARWHPRQWVAQRRFRIRPVASPDGPLYPCVGVYTVDGQAAGVYGRVSANPIINHLARDTAVLLRREPAGGHSAAGQGNWGEAEGVNVR